MAARSDDDTLDHEHQRLAPITRREALVGAAAVAASGGLLAATSGFAADAAPMLMLPAVVARVHSDAVADLVPLGSKMTLETEISSRNAFAGADAPGGFSGYTKGQKVLVMTSGSLPPGDSYGHGDPNRLRGLITAEMVVPLSLGSIDALANR